MYCYSNQNDSKIYPNYPTSIASLYTSANPNIVLNVTIKSMRPILVIVPKAPICSLDKVKYEIEVIIPTMIIMLLTIPRASNS